LSRTRFYVDEDAMDGELIAGLRLNGLDVQSAHEAGLIETPDEVHLDFASGVGRALYTFNQADFPRIHGEWFAAGRTHAGIVVGAQQRYSVGEQIRRLIRIVTSLTAEQMVNRIEFLGSWGR
jgi:hypothetical protein